MLTEPRILRNIQIQIGREQLYKRLKGVSPPDVESTSLRLLVDRAITEGFVLIEPKASYRDFNIASLDDQQIFLEGSDFVLQGKKITGHLRDAFRVSFFVVTVGDALEQSVKDRTAKGLIAEAAVLDAFGSEAAEALAEYMNGIIHNNALLEGAVTVKRFSPGYGDWPLAVQGRLLSLLEAQRIEVRVNEACLMVPEKSVSAVVGWKRTR